MKKKIYHRRLEAVRKSACREKIRENKQFSSRRGKIEKKENRRTDQADAGSKKSFSEAQGSTAPIVLTYTWKKCRRNRKQSDALGAFMGTNERLEQQNQAQNVFAVLREKGKTLPAGKAVHSQGKKKASGEKSENRGGFFGFSG